MSNPREVNRRIDKSGKEPEYLTYYEMKFDPIREDGSKLQIYIDTLRYKWQVFEHKTNWLTWERDETSRGWIIADYYKREEELYYDRLYWYDEIDHEIHQESFKLRGGTVRETRFLQPQSLKCIFREVGTGIFDPPPCETEYSRVPFPQYDASTPKWLIALRKRGIIYDV